MSIQPLNFANGVDWVVTRQEPDQVNFASPGDPVYGVNIYFQTAQGNSGVVFVSYANYGNVKGIHTAIERAASLADQVSNLASNSFPR